MATPKGKSKDSTWEDILNEMNDKTQMEDLRAHLTTHGLFPRDVDPATAPIKMEYLQKLARQWKLHHKRGFWKDHASQSSLVVALHHHHVLLTGAAKGKAARQKEESKEAPGTPKEAPSPLERERDREKDALPFAVSRLPVYHGDKFGTRGAYVDGTVYLSRFASRAMDAGDDAKRASVVSDPEAKSRLRQLAVPDSSGSDVESEEGPDGADSSETAKNCALALCNFSTSAGFHSKIIAVGAVTSLVDTWTTCEEGMKEDVAIALCKLASEESRAAMIEDGALPAILSLATSRPEVQQLCASTLALLSSLDEIVPVLVSDGALPALESLSSSSDPGTRLLTATVLRNMANQKSNRAVMIKEDAIKTLLSLTMDTLVDTRRNATVALSMLCRHKRSQPKILAENVSLHLVRLCKSEDAETQSCASQAICSLCYNKGTRMRLVREGVVSIVTKQAASSELALQQKAAMALLYLSTEEGPIRLEILENNAVQLLLGLSTTGDEKTRQGCAMALCNILCDPDTQHRILELDALSAFDALAKCNEDIQLKAVATLLFLVKDSATGAKVVEQNGLSSLLALTTAPSNVVKLQCVTAFQYLSVNPVNHKPMVQAGVVQKVIQFSSMHDEAFKRGCAHVITNLGCTMELHDQLKEFGVLPILLQLSTFDVASSYVAVGLCNFTANPAMRRVLIDAGAVPVLIGLAKTTSESTKQECCRAICNLSSLEGSEPSITNGGGAAGLIMVALFRTDTAETKRVCASALLNLMTQPQCREQLIKEDVVWVLIKLAASEESNDSTRTVCGRAICSLSYNQKGCVKLLEHKAIPAIDTLCRDGDERTKRYASITLCNLSAVKEYHEQMMAQRAVGCLVKLADTTDEETRLHSIGTLCNLSTTPSCRARMIEQNASAALNLAKGGNKESLRRCALALVNLSSVVALQSQFVTQGALGGLLKLASGGSTLIQILCARALYNLSFDRKAREELVKANALPALVIVSASDSEYTMGLCSVSFFNISQISSCHAALCDSGALAAIVRVTKATSNPDTRRAGYLAICNISTTKQCHSDMLEQGVVQVLSELLAAFPTDPELISVCVRTLRNVSFTSALRPRLIEIGISSGFVTHCTTDVEDVREDCIAGLCNLCKEEHCIDSLAKQGVIAALATVSKIAVGDTLRNIAHAHVHVTRPPELRATVVQHGIMDSLSILLKSELDDVKKLCSVSIRNLSSDPAVQAKMVDSGMVALLIDFMAVKEDGRRSPMPPAHHRHTVLPNPVHGWEPGRPAEATTEIVAPGFSEAAVIPDGKLPEDEDEYEEDEDNLGDLGQAAGVKAARALSVVALGEPLWQKLHGGDMELSHTVPMQASGGAGKLETPRSDILGPEVESEQIKSVSRPVSRESREDDESYFDFKLASPSADFYKKQAAQGPRAVISFESLKGPQSPTKLPRLGSSSKPTTASSASSTRAHPGTKLPKVV